jgi:hypothetical protein
LNPAAGEAEHKQCRCLLSSRIELTSFERNIPANMVDAGKSLPPNVTVCIDQNNILSAHGNVGTKHGSVCGLRKSCGGRGGGVNEEKRRFRTSFDRAFDTLLCGIIKSPTIVKVSVQCSRWRDDEATARSKGEREHRNFSVGGRVNGFVRGNSFNNAK